MSYQPLASVFLRPITLMFICLTVFHNGAQAQVTNIAPEKIRTLSSHPEWLNLLHYKPGYLRNRLESQVDDAKFFLAVDGQRNAQAELQAYLQHLPDSLQQSDPEAVQCRFPARFQWLQQHLPELKRYQRPCAELDQWRQTLNADSASLIFPASYLNSPSSMYGHTLLRLDQPNQNESNRLVAYSVNFAAVADDTDNELVFSWKGLTGGYPGHISVMPYYEKVNEYNGMENRDIWEFKLSLNPEETAQLINHLWEILEIRFDYFFFDENCSYRVLTLLDIAKPNTNSAEDFRWHAIPTDTIRTLFDKNLVTEAHYRPSQASILKGQLQQLTAEQKVQVHSLASNDSTLSLSEQNNIQQQATLETAYQYSRYLAHEQETDLRSINQRSLKLLSRRSKLPSGSPLLAPAAPAIRDDQGHQTSRLAITSGYQEDKGYLELSARIAYHDLLDPLDGYIYGAQIEMGELSVRAYSDKVDIQRLALLNIRSLTPRDDFFAPLSWHVAAGAERQARHEDEDQRKLGLYLDAGGGHSYELSDSVMAFAFWDGSLRQGPDLEDNGMLGTGPQLGLYGRFNAEEISGQWQVSGHHYRYLNFNGHNRHNKESQMQAAVAFNLGSDTQLRLRTRYIEALQAETLDFQAGIYWYY